MLPNNIASLALEPLEERRLLSTLVAEVEPNNRASQAAGPASPSIRNREISAVFEIEVLSALSRSNVTH